ncbi:hypothetical protein ABZ671_01500 [Micromonospora sp. NPDC006766]|uniref:hypothetical protein n=1 Tax=Micromonospora sp. NPDC006766 TaxID=3154778 RepID=UPI0033ED7FAD
MDVARIRRQLRAQLVREATTKFGRWDRRAKEPMRCKAGDYERWRTPDLAKTSIDKVIIDGLDNALALAKELQRLGSGPLEPYVCHRSRTGHYHLRTREARKKRTRRDNP